MYKVKCSICHRLIGFYGFHQHVKMHKKRLGEDIYLKIKEAKRGKLIIKTFIKGEEIKQKRRSQLTLNV